MKIEAFLICDDIRTEISNKQSFIGVYDDTIQFDIKPSEVNQWPKHMKLGVFARFIVESGDKLASSFKLKLDYNGEISEIVGGGFVTPKGKEIKKVTFVFVNPAFIFKGEGEIDFIFEFYDENANILYTIKPSHKIKVVEKVEGV